MYRSSFLDFPQFSRTSDKARPARDNGTVHLITKLIAIIVLAFAPPALAQDSAGATVRGTVIDARTGAALGRVLVSIEDGPSADTSADGRFALEDVVPGTRRLYVSAIGYGLVQRTLELLPGDVLDLQIPLSEGAATYTETVKVTADRFRRPDPVVPAQHSIRGFELQNLRGVLADDALRAVQVLPGVATGDDFRSEFTVRGSDFGHLNFTVDGFATPFLLHMVRAVEERANTGSVTMINGDVLEEVTLSNGSYAQRSGNRTGAELAFVMREGSRDRNLVRAAISGTSTSGVVEGPLGRSKRGSWLVSGRKSYLDLLIDRLSDEGLSFGFSDVQAKLRYDFTDRQTASLTFIAGESTLKETPDDPDDDELFIGHNASAIVIANWRKTFRLGMVSAGMFGATNAFDNHTVIGVELENGSNDQISARADVTLRLSANAQIESGALVEYIDERQERSRLVNSTTTSLINDYRDDAARRGAYVRASAHFGKLHILPGARVDHWELTNQTTSSPWLQTELTASHRFVLRAAGGLYQQFPDFAEVIGAFAGNSLQPERSIHADISVEHRLSPSTRLQLTIYNRRDERLIRRPGADTRLEGGRLVRGSLTARYENRLDGYARGAEFLVQRSSPTSLSGWVSYAYGRNRYQDRVTGEEHWGDLDQRHTLNAYGFYRVSRRFSASAKFRMGTNFPVPGFYTRQESLYFVSDRRNQLRLPSYARLDLRADRTFDWSRKRLTLFIEVINVLNRENVRFNPPRVTTATRQVTRLFDSLVPVVPSAGILLEF